MTTSSQGSVRGGEAASSFSVSTSVAWPWNLARSAKRSASSLFAPKLLP